MIDQSFDKKCAGCIININCGGTDCIPTTPSYTRETTVWTIPPTQTPPTLAPTWTYATARPTPKSCMCACYMPPPCQICQPCQ
ncbi:hypothetical protein LOAG_15385 [Loa loa]|uniref:Uncharacterized protein n=1 Tax=Loa loa TaxID=7209 RepID=A0A1S0TGA5_LOALO|nr:hypothetical protein LOAG_15385 [Loa loa]EFO13146.2 hypothetical protein LOAG_15385 [Loa loa]